MDQVLLQPDQAVFPHRGGEPPQEPPSAGTEADFHPLFQERRQRRSGQGDVPEDHDLAQPDEGHPDFLLRPSLLLILRQVDDQ